MGQLQSTPPAGMPADDRLESWKEIAVFLGKGVRTVQRWELTERLPVHRHAHEKGSTVYACKSELAQWCAARESQSGQQAGSEGAVRGDNEKWLFKPRIVAAVGSLVLLICAGILLIRRPALHPGPVLTPRLLISHVGRASQAVISPVGDQVVYCWNGREGGTKDLDLYVAAIERGTSRRLTNHPANDHSPAWSPDGEVIASIRDNEGVFLIPAAGGPERKLVQSGPGTMFAVGMSWSPSGRWLVFSERASAQEPFRLFLANAQTGEKRSVTSPPKNVIGDAYASWSPDGRKVAFLREVKGLVNDIHVVRISTEGRPESEVVRITSDNGHILGLDWLPDGSGIIFSSNRSQTRRLWSVPVLLKGGLSDAPRAVAFAGEEAYQPSISRGTSRLVYSRRYWTSSIVQARLADKPKSTVEATETLIASTREDFYPEYSPDGSRIAFSSTRSGATEIWVSNSDGSDAMQATSLRGPGAYCPRWSPDGQHLAFHAGGSPSYGILVIPASGGPAIKLTEGRWPSWSADGRWIYYTSDSGGTNQVWKVPAQGGRPMQVTQKGGEVPLESPDGKWLYFRMDGIWRVPVKGGVETRVVGPPVGSFKITERGVFFDRGSGDFIPSSIHFLDFASGGITLVVKSGLSKRNGLSVSPDGRSVLFAVREREGSELMVLEGVH